MKQSTAIATVVAVVVVAFFLGELIYQNEGSSNAAVTAAATATDQSQNNTLSTTATSTTTTPNVAGDTIATSTNPVTTTQDGLQIQDVTIGTGVAAKAGDTVSVNYVGTLTDGTKFDSSYDRGQPISFTLGAGRVIPGWDEGLVGMKVGGTRTLVIPPSLGYGDNAVGPIPANSTLIFQVALVKIGS